MFTLSSLHHPLPVKLRRFWCNEIPFLAYQLPDGEIAMSEVQLLPVFSLVLSEIIGNFICENNLQVIRAILPNHTKANIYPLSTIIAIWNYLLSLDKLSHRQELLTAFAAGKPVLENSDFLPTRLGDIRIKPEEAPATLAKSINIQIEKVSLCILCYQGIFYISDTEGLSIINVPLSWIIELNPAEKKARTIKRNGFSFKEETLFYENTNVFKVRARLWSEWLIIWEYFAAKGNTKALSLLRGLAKQGIEQKLELYRI
jgi:hypothetical protein